VIGPLVGGVILDNALLAVDLCAQRADRCRDDRVDPHRSARKRDQSRPPRRLRRGRAVCSRPRLRGLRTDRGAALRLGKPVDPDRAGGRHRLLRRVPRVRTARTRANAEARVVHPAELRLRQSRDTLRVRRPFNPLLLPHDLPPAGRGLQRPRERPDDPAGDTRHVLHSRSASAHSPIGSARASSWAPGR